MWMVSVKPVPDALGRIDKLHTIPLEELGRPRIDVAIDCSGVFRDLFVILNDSDIGQFQEYIPSHSIGNYRKCEKSTFSIDCIQNLLNTEMILQAGVRIISHIFEIIIF
jgi:CobN/Magnesium Chelatase